MSNQLLTFDAIASILQARLAHERTSITQIPAPELLYNLPKAVTRITQAIAHQEPITIVGDYDVDGVVSTAIMLDFFGRIGYDVKAIIPNRFRDGYGVSAAIIDQIESGVVITVDNGINAIEAAQKCREKGIDLIITDHHTPSEILPDAYAIIDPKLSQCTYPFKEICGAQVAWLLLSALKKSLGLSMDMRTYFDLLSVAIIADVMPLVDINRAIVQKGLAYMSHSSRPAFALIRAHLNKENIGSEDIAFQLAPRINAAGRIEDASIALGFLSAKSLDEARYYFDHLDSLNTYRKDIEAQSTKLALAHANGEDSIIVVALPELHEGVVGIIASRLVSHFQKPAIVLSIDGDSAKGSARSIGEVNLHALLEASSAYLRRFGGHKMAAGLTLDVAQLEAFKAHINSVARQLDPTLFIPKEDVLGILPPDEITFELVEMMAQYEPFGEANPRPKFMLQAHEVLEVQRFGANHLRFWVASPHYSRLSVVGFSRTETIQAQERINFSFTLNKNSFRDQTTLQLMLDRVW
ncbi:MAG: hypothetical protein KU37_02320 [Sulfuricurvum sp. PC08-66]|nr:MAG: hypothetical protein KU37_02320 [Sulfuricurvum sp. PC08-66]